jgi:hypothetical protein
MTDDYSKCRLAVNSFKAVGRGNLGEDAAEKRIVAHIESFRDARASGDPRKSAFSPRDHPSRP